jgi:hypothetical protein
VVASEIAPQSCSAVLPHCRQVGWAAGVATVAVLSAAAAP